MSQNIVRHEPGAILSRAVEYNGMVFLAGLTADDYSLDIKGQTEQVLKNIHTILKAGGSDLQHVLRCGVYLIDIGEFKLMNGVYARMFGSHTPARTTVQVAALPAPGLRVEIDCVAYVP